MVMITTSSKTYWHTVKHALYQFVNFIFHNKQADMSLNEAIFTLLPKTNNPDNIRQYRPISLCPITFMFFTKVLVNRIRPLVGKLVSPNQKSIIPNRGININYIVASEDFHSVKKLKGKIGF